MKVAALQMVSHTSVDVNLKTATGLLEEAAAQGAELIVLPEYFAMMGLKDTDKLAIQETLGVGPIQQFLSTTARKHGVWIVGGTLPLTTHNPAQVRNSCLVFSPSGAQVARYDKIHLFAFDNGAERYDEAHTIEPGDTPVCFNLPSKDGHTWRVGLSVCYDLRFAALYQTLHADVLLVPSAFTHTTGQAHWQSLLQARAIENMAYVLAPAQGGHHANGRHTWGHSMLVDGWGLVCHQLDSGAGVVIGEMSYAQLTQWRTQLPALAHRKILSAVQNSA